MSPSSALCPFIGRQVVLCVPHTHSYLYQVQKLRTCSLSRVRQRGLNARSPVRLVLKSESSPMRQQSVTTPVALFRTHSLIELQSVHTLVFLSVLSSPHRYYYGSAFFQACLSWQSPKSSASSPKISATHNNFSAKSKQQQTSHHPISRRTRWNPIGPTELNK